MAGVRQIVQPEFTATAVFGIQDCSAYSRVRELGFVTLSVGLLAVVSLLYRPWVEAVALAGHSCSSWQEAIISSAVTVNLLRKVALCSDLFIVSVLVAYLGFRVVGSGRLRPQKRSWAGESWMLRLSNGQNFVLPITILAVSVLSGGGYAWLFDQRLSVSVIHAVFIGVPILAYERGLLLPELRAWTRRSSTIVYGPVSLLLFIAIIAFGNAIAGLLLWVTAFATAPLAESAILNLNGLTYSVVVAGVAVMAFRMRDLIGSATFLNLLLGRYRKPVSEERIFMFLDLVGSTRFADQHGALRTQEFLGRVFEVLAGPVRQHGGTFDDYIGDMAMVTWRLKPGKQNSAVVHCLFAFLEEVECRAGEWRRQFGEVPRFRAALHCGRVVTAEIGLDRHKITYFGDVVNTTSRLEGLAKALGTPIVISADLLNRMEPLPANIRASDLGVHELRGRNEQLAVASLERATAGP